MTLSRRAVLTHGAAIAAAAALPSTEASALTVIQRPNVSSLPLNHPILVSYRAAIKAMIQLPTSDPRNWTRQAQIHNGNNVVRCPHGNWYFLPWHRAYLLAFEKICRQLSGDPNFALPYWDWTANPQLPAAFASPTFNGQPNPLFNGSRSSQTVTIPSTIAGSQRMAQILSETTFEIFGSSKPNGQNNTSQPWQIASGAAGPLESGPHNYTHGAIGGDMGTYMSPLDPIFWLHHCNIDRIWDQWNRMGRLNTTNPLWSNFSFNNQFVVPSGNSTTPYNVAPSGLLNIQQLGYRYVSPLWLWTQFLVTKPAIDLSKLVQVTQVKTAAVAKLNTQLSLSVKLDQPQATLLKKIQLIAPEAMPKVTSAAAPASITAAGRILAFIRDVEAPSKGNTEVRVFVNCPYLKPDTSPEDQHYAGSFTFFGGPEHAGHGGQTYLFDLTETVRRLRATESDVTNEVNVQLMPVPIPGIPSDNLEFKVGSIDIAII